MINLRLAIIIFFLALIIFASEYIIYASLNTVGIIRSERLETILMALGIVIPLSFIISLLINYKHYSSFWSSVNVIGSIWLAMILYVFMAAVLIFVLMMINHYLNLNIPIKLISSIMVLIVILITSYGIYNSENIRIKNYSIKSEVLSKEWGDKKIIIVSDIHLGNIKGEKFLDKLINEINSEKPDIVFIVGDLIEGTSFPYEKWFSYFSKLNPPLGNQYVEGNHEKYNQEYALFKSKLPSNLNNLTDKKIIINNTQIIGLSFREQESKKKTIGRLQALGYDKEIPSIILMHNPKNTKALASIKASLVLSGHSHAGQFFPFTTLMKFIYGKYNYGLVYTNKTVSVTTDGVGTSMIPLRLGSDPEIVVIDIEK